MKFVISSRFDGVEPKLSGNDVRFADGVMRWQVTLDAASEQYIYASAEELRTLAQRFWELADEANVLDLQRIREDVERRSADARRMSEAIR